MQKTYRNHRWTASHSHKKECAAEREGGGGGGVYAPSDNRKKCGAAGKTCLWAILSGLLHRSRDLSKCCLNVNKHDSPAGLWELTTSAECNPSIPALTSEKSLLKKGESAGLSRTTCRLRFITSPLNVMSMCGCIWSTWQKKIVLSTSSKAPNPQTSPRAMLKWRLTAPL